MDNAINLDRLRAARLECGFTWTAEQKAALTKGCTVVCDWTDEGPMIETVYEADSRGAVFDDATEAEWYLMDPESVVAP